MNLGARPRLGFEHADVVRNEPVHGRLGSSRRHVEGLFRGHQAAIAIVEHIEQLRVHMGQLFTRVRVRSVHGRGESVGNEALAGILGPPWNRVRQVLAEDSLERLDLTGLVEPAEQVVEGTVLEHQDHDVVECVRCCRSGHAHHLQVSSSTLAGPNVCEPKASPWVLGADVTE